MKLGQCLMEKVKELKNSVSDLLILIPSLCLLGGGVYCLVAGYNISPWVGVGVGMLMAVFWVLAD